MKDSAYNLCIRDNEGGYGLFNTRTGAARLMDPHAYRFYWAAANGIAPLEEAAETLEQLVAGGFLVDNEVDELAEIEAAHLKARMSQEMLALVIAPSMACNLDCFYCFETNRYPGRMSQETQRRLLALARRYVQTGTKRLAVTWYGGEPLLALSTIERLSKAFLALCEEFACAYSADIVTNGTLLTRVKAERLASWKVARAQITLDGAPELHDRRRVPKDGAPTFDKVLDGIEAAAAHMHVSIRINVCRQVAQRLEELLALLAARGLNAKASVYLAPLRGVPDFADRRGRGPQRHGAPVAGAGRMEEIGFLSAAEAGELTLQFRRLLRAYGFAVHPDVLPQPRATTCIGDRDHSWLVEANGNIHKCYWTAGQAHEAVGHLTGEGIRVHSPLQKWRDWSAFRRSDCAHCVLLPLCLGLCPLRQMQGEPDRCPSFRHNWQHLLAHALGLAAEEVTPIHLPLAGERLRYRAVSDVGKLPSQA